MLAIRLALTVIRLRVAIYAREACVVGAVDMAIIADCSPMRQLPPGMGERGVGPSGRVVAGGAGGRKSGCNVIWNAAAQGDSALPGSLMATVAIRRKIAGVIIVDVARGTGRLRGVRMRASQSETSGGVIKLPRRPGRDRMAGGAHGGSARKACGDVIRNRTADGGRAIPCSGMATHAVGRAQRVIVVYMARSAGSRSRRHMSTDKGEARDAVIERGRVPTGSGVTGGTICDGKCGARS